MVEDLAPLRNLVERIRDEHDRRGVRVQLTRLGESELERVGNERNKYLAEMLATLGEEDLDRISEVTDIINHLADSYGADLIDTNGG